MLAKCLQKKMVNLKVIKYFNCRKHLNREAYIRKKNGNNKSRGATAFNYVVKLKCYIKRRKIA